VSELSDKQARLAALIKIRDSGVAGVRSGDDRVDFRSQNDIFNAISALEQEISDLSGMRTVRNYRITTCKGL
jgi:hypothetical protein